VAFDHPRDRQLSTIKDPVTSLGLREKKTRRTNGDFFFKKPKAILRH
jgi:hypothetical protein